MSTVLLHSLAHARTGDKGDRSSISLVAYDAKHWALLVEQVDGPVRGAVALATS